MIEQSPPIKPRTVDYNLLRVTHQSCFLCLSPHHAPQVSSFLKRELPNVKSIIDGTAHIGCDTLNFGLTYPEAQITAIDIDPQAFTCLDQNVKTVFNLEGEQARFKLLQEDFVVAMRTFPLPVDLIYLDPPWGGPEYYKKQRLMLYLSDLPIYVIINDLFAKKASTYILLKVPKNFDVIEFTNHLSFSPWIKFFNVLKPNNRIAFSLLLIKQE